MEPAELQKQPQPRSYEQKVNEMQKMLPRLEQRIANAGVEKENEEELHKLKLLQRVLCGQAATAADDGSFTIEELDKYAELLGNGLALPTTRVEMVMPTASFAVNVTDDKCEAANLEAKENVDDSNAKNQHNLEAIAYNDKLIRKTNVKDTEEFQKLCDNKQIESFEKESNSITKANSTNCVDLERAEEGICEIASESLKKISKISEKEMTRSVGDDKTIDKESCVNETETGAKKDEITEKERESFESFTESSVTSNAKRDQRSKSFTKDSKFVENDNCVKTLETLEESKKFEKGNKSTTIGSSSPEKRGENSSSEEKNKSSSSEKKNKSSSSDKRSERLSSEKEMERSSSDKKETKNLSSEKSSESLDCGKESESSSSKPESQSSSSENANKSLYTKKESESSIKTIGICGNQIVSSEQSTESLDEAIAMSEKRNENTTESTESVNVSSKTNTATQFDSSERNSKSPEKEDSAVAFEETEKYDKSLRQPEDKQSALAREFPSDAEDPEDIEYEEVELIKIPEGTAEDEMILPDSADEAEYNAPSSDEEEVEQGEVAEVEEDDSQKCEENIKTVVAEAEENVSKSCTRSENDSNELEETTQDTSSTKNLEDSQERIENYKADSSAEEEAKTHHDENEESNNTTTDSPLPVEFAIEMDNQIETPTELEETTHTDDPLSQVDSLLDNEIEAINKHVDEASAGSSVNILEMTRSESCGAAKANTVQMEDDDDVEIIETRNSPICLDTDDEDEKLACVMPFADKTLIRSSTVTVTLQKNAMRTQRQHIKNTNARAIPANTIKSVNSITETINLLDSSDEEGTKSNNSSQMSRRSRRCAMPTVTRTLVKMPTATVGRKRTLLPVNQGAKSTKPKQALIGGTLSSSCRALLSNSDSSHAASTSTQKAVTLFKPTPQSNFLNAVNLLPATATSGDNPLAFSAKLLDRNIIIPNAFYANRRTSVKDKKADTAEQSTSSSAPVEKPSTTTIQQNLLAQHTVSPVYREWLNEFINNFADPQQIASHTCLVLLQSALKYKTFARIKELRLALNTKAYSSNCTTDPHLARELNNNFYLGDCRLSTEALRFCSDACTQIGKNVTLMTDAHTGRITMRTNTYDELHAKYGAGNANGGCIGIDDKRKRNKKDEEYTPAKYYEKKVEESTVNQGERRKSLRQHRTRCYDETYLYEQEGTEEEKPAIVEPKAGPSKRRQDAQMIALVQRKAEEKRLEAKRQRQKQVKSFESAYLAMFANTIRSKNVKASVTATNKDTQATTSSNAHIVIDDDDEDTLEDGEPPSHRIYKVVPTRLLAAPKRLAPTPDCPNDTDENTSKTKRGRPRKQELCNGKVDAKSNECELITCDSTSGDSTSIDDELLFAPDQTIPKNTNANWHALNDRCRICNKNVPRIVLHYVSMHPDTEVYSSRLPRATMARLRSQGGQILELRPYMNGQEQYAADCVFCNKQCCFKIPYWYQHLSMHTGEYAYRCSGCHIRKATRSSMVAHISQPCRKRGKLLEDYVYRTRTNVIEMRICTLCNFMQLHRRNILKHLRTQHGLMDNLAKHVDNVILLRMPQPQMLDIPVRDEQVDLNSGEDEKGSNQVAMTFNYDNFENAVQPGMWDAGDPTDDLSFMICGMLDVQLGNMEQ
uniref:Uncharacterized protein n=1 Tax=Ceratitis capitata TaxID=7213 RepID=W8C9N2_CERCA